jgi:hypothetical protein
MRSDRVSFKEKKEEGKGMKRNENGNIHHQ